MAIEISTSTAQRRLKKQHAQVMDTIRLEECEKDGRRKVQGIKWLHTPVQHGGSGLMVWRCITTTRGVDLLHIDGMVASALILTLQ